jgi:hypothetical protein
VNYEEKILTYLVENYRKSRKDSGDNKTNRRTQLKPEKIYKKYRANDGDYEEISAINEAVKTLENLGFVTVTRETFGTAIQCVYLVDNRINDIEKYLEENYGYESKDSKLLQFQNLIKRYQATSDICRRECEKIKGKLDKRQLPKDTVKETEEILKAVSFIENNEEELYVREVSMKVYGDSKYFEKNTLNAVCTLLRRYSDEIVEENEIEDEILGSYHIYREPQKISIKGRTVLKINGTDVDISGFDEGVEFSTSVLPALESVKLLAPAFMTIENRTSYLRYSDENTVVFYLGGYTNRAQRDFLKLVCDCNPQTRYMHFGDIDAGGFWIHNHLCEITGVDFELFCMSIAELEDLEYASCLHELTDNDMARLQELKNITAYKKVVNYMLEKNVKLEQEIVSLNLMSK